MLEPDFKERVEILERKQKLTDEYLTNKLNRQYDLRL